MFIEVRHLSKSYSSGSQRLQVLDDLEFSAEKGDMVGLLGTSGSGKSTFLNILGSMDSADSGEIILNGFSFSGKSEKDFTAFRQQQVGFIFQFHYLLPEFTAVENAAIPAMIAGRSRKDAQAAALELLEFLHVADRAHHYPAELSGGEKQRVSIARALINTPAVLLADEPTGNLDRENALQVMELFARINDEFRQTILMVSHDAVLMEPMKRVCELKGGRLHCLK